MADMTDIKLDLATVGSLLETIVRRVEDAATSAIGDRNQLAMQSTMLMDHDATVRRLRGNNHILAERADQSESRAIKAEKKLEKLMNEDHNGWTKLEPGETYDLFKGEKYAVEYDVQTNGGGLTWAEYMVTLDVTVQSDEERSKRTWYVKPGVKVDKDTTPTLLEKMAEVLTSMEDDGAPWETADVAAMLEEAGVELVEMKK